MNHADFRIQGRIFATLGYPDENFGMVKLPPPQQRAFIEKSPTVFAPCAGAWGRQGATSIHLARAKFAQVRAAIRAASSQITSKAKNNL
jgi:hypothetical protein